MQSSRKICKKRKGKKNHLVLNVIFLSCRKMRFRDEHKLDYHLFIARGSEWIWWGCFSFITELRPEQSCWLSALVNFSFSFNTIFLSGQGLMAAEWTPFGVSLPIRNQKLKRNGKNGWTKITLTSPLKNGCGKGLLASHYCMSSAGNDNKVWKQTC